MNPANLSVGNHQGVITVTAAGARLPGSIQISVSVAINQGHARNSYREHARPAVRTGSRERSVAAATCGEKRGRGQLHVFGRSDDRERSELAHGVAQHGRGHFGLAWLCDRDGVSPRALAGNLLRHGHAHIERRRSECGSNADGSSGRAENSTLANRTLVPGAARRQ